MWCGIISNSAIYFHLSLCPDFTHSRAPFWSVSVHFVEREWNSLINFCLCWHFKPFDSLLGVSKVSPYFFFLLFLFLLFLLLLLFLPFLMIHFFRLKISFLKCCFCCVFFFMLCEWVCLAVGSSFYLFDSLYLCQCVYLSVLLSAFLAGCLPLILLIPSCKSSLLTFRPSFLFFLPSFSPSSFTFSFSISFSVSLRALP